MIVHILICAYLSYTAIAVNFPLFWHLELLHCHFLVLWIYLWASALYLDLCDLCEVTVSDLPLVGVLDGPVVRRGYYHPLFIDIIIFSPLGL